MFESELKSFFCDQPISNYFLRGLKGEIYINLEPTSFDEDFGLIYVKYLFYIYSAYSRQWFDYLEEPRTSVEVKRDPSFKESLIRKLPEKLINEKYFNKKKSEGKDVIDLFISVEFDSREPNDPMDELSNEITSKIKKYNLEKIYNIAIPIYKEDWQDDIYDPFGASEFFLGLKNQIENNAGEMFVDNEKYFNWLYSIGKMGYEYNKKKSFNINIINNLANKLKLHKYFDYPLIYFVKDLLNSLINFIFSEGKIANCQYCGDFIIYRKGKKYCSQKSELKYCGKAAGNKRYYQKKKLNQK